MIRSIPNANIVPNEEATSCHVIDWHNLVAAVSLTCRLQALELQCRPGMKT